jgi:hypothetical protein
VRTLLRTPIAWREPESCVFGLAAVAWVAIAGSALGSRHHETHAMAWPMYANSSWLIVRGMADWMLMVVAMMFPLTAGALHTTVVRSLWRRRHRAIAAWLAGYIVPWLLLGGAFTVLTAAAGHGTVPRPWVITAFVLAALWQATEKRARALNAAHRTWPLAPTGWPATRDCLRAGLVTSIYCAAACGPLMVACALLGHGPSGVAAMICATAMAVIERYSVRPDPRLLGAGVILPALVAAAW